MADDEKCVQVGSFVWKWDESVGWYDVDDGEPTFGYEGVLLDEIVRLRAEVAAWRKDAHGLPPANTWRCPECGGTLGEATHTEDCAYWIGG